jgi:hypothetical protein
MSRNAKDLSNRKFGQLTAIRIIDKTKHGRNIWECLCSCGKYYNVQSSSLIGKKTTRCVGCTNKKRANSKRLTYDYVLNYFKSEGCQLLEHDYINTDHKLNYICSCGNSSKISFHNFKSGQRCYKCSGKTKHTLESVIKIFQERKCILLEHEYINNSKSMRYVCSCGLESKINLNNFLNGNRCKKCGYNKNTGSNNKKWNPDREKVKLKRKIANFAYSAIRRCLNYSKDKKDVSSELLLGYTKTDLLNHIYKHNDWSNVKDQEWHIDHIFPIKAFIDFNIYDIKIINSLDNLRPMLEQDNLSKSGKYDKNLFKEWLKLKGVNIDD